MNDSGTVTRKAIETEYNGFRFRSRLEARWAVFFDSMGIKYQYEPEGFEFSDGTRYLPDFYLPESDVYFEVKGVMKGEDIKKILNLCKSGANVLVGDNDFNIRSPLEYVIPQLSLEFAVKDAKKNAKQARFEHREKPKVASDCASDNEPAYRAKDLQDYAEMRVLDLIGVFCEKATRDAIEAAKRTIKPEYFRDAFRGKVFQLCIEKNYHNFQTYADSLTPFEMGTLSGFRAQLKNYVGWDSRYISVIGEKEDQKAKELGIALCYNYSVNDRVEIEVYADIMYETYRMNLGTYSDEDYRRLFNSTKNI